MCHHLMGGKTIESKYRSCEELIEIMFYQHLIIAIGFAPLPHSEQPEVYYVVLFT